MKVSINDRIVDIAEASIGVYDLGLNRGYAVFDYFNIVNGNFRFFEDHLKRFMRSIHYSKIPCAYTIDNVRDKIVQLKEINAIQNGYVRITLTGGTSTDFASIPQDSHLIIVLGRYDAVRFEEAKTGVKLISKQYQRLIAHIKTTDYFFAQMHREEMLNADAVDVLYFNEYITETSKANIFFVKDGTLYTPEANILEGITRKKVLDLYPDTVRCNIRRDQISEFDEVFMCSSTREISPVIKIDEQGFDSGRPDGKVSEVMERFRAHCQMM